jgi:hypothetical protein
LYGARLSIRQWTCGSPSTSGSIIGLFSKRQVSIFKARTGGSSSTSICNTFKICNDEAPFFDSPGIELAKAADQRIYPASVKCTFKRLSPNHPVREFNN